MGVLGCTPNGTLDDSKFNQPMPWIGLYVVAASAACALAMALDAFHGFRYRKFWFPSKFFALNATTLTLIGVAVKLSVDLNTSMPRVHDQLAKLSSTAFICTAIGNSMPSLGTMENKELMMNVVALGILVVTVLVNVCIQLGTGVIYVFWIEHVVVLFLMVVLFAIMVSSALAIPATKYYFDVKYSRKYEIAKEDCANNCNTSVAKKLQEDLMRYWMMAHTCNPQFVMGRLATCTASGAFCLLSALTLGEAMLRSYLMPWCFTFCKGESDYRWSIMLILVTQAIAVLGGTIAPASRWFIAIKFMCPKRAMKPNPNGFPSVEKYWVKMLYLLKECPFDLRFCGRHGRRMAYNAKNGACDFCILLQKGMVLLSKSARLVSVLIVSRLLAIHRSCKKLVKLVPCRNTVQNCDMESDSKTNRNMDLGRYVLHLEGEEALIDMMMESDRDATGHWIKMGRKKQPKYLIQLLEKLNPSCGFEGVLKFDVSDIPSLGFEEPPNSWALPVVTLTSIAIAVNNPNLDSVKDLIQCVHEGLKYIRVVENNLEIKTHLANVRKAAEAVWLGVDIHCRWLDEDLLDLALQGKSPKETLSKLSDIAKSKFMEFQKTDIMACLGHSPARWPTKLLATNSMYRICQTLLLTNDNRSNENSNVMIEKLTVMITDIMGACLTNLEHAISSKCHQSTIEHREESVRHAILLLGRTEKILEILGSQKPPNSDPEKMTCINRWRGMNKEDRMPSTNSDSDFTPSTDFYLEID